MKPGRIDSKSGQNISAWAFARSGVNGLMNRSRFNFAVKDLKPSSKSSFHSTRLSAIAGFIASRSRSGFSFSSGLEFVPPCAPPVRRRPSTGRLPRSRPAAPLPGSAPLVREAPPPRSTEVCSPPLFRAARRARFLSAQAFLDSSVHALPAIESSPVWLRVECLKILWSRNRELQAVGFGREPVFPVRARIQTH